jgi:hypothetical protein
MRSRRRRVVFLLLLAAVALAGGKFTYAAFTKTTANYSDTYAAGTVILANNSAGAALLSLTNAVPTLASQTDTGCITVTYTGSLPANVRLYATVGGTGLATYLGVTVTRGSFSPSAPAYRSCTNFVADATTYVAGQAPGVIYNGTLAGFGSSYAAGLVDPTAGTPASWTTGTSRVYKYTVLLQDTLAARGKNATASFSWEARNA